MRMRRKKNLEARLDEFSEYLIIPRTGDMDFRNAVNHTDYFDIASIFGNDHPIRLEIGCGKGQFAVEMAKRNPDINFFAVEKFANVLVDACEKLRESGLQNLKFINCSAEYLPSFIEPHTVQRIYLNFSCPFPKKAYASHRLTAPHFLSVYERLLVPHGEIHQKTDNRQLFEFSINNLSEYGYTLKNVTLDLHSSDFEGNIVTEYEKRFSDLGFPIFRLEAYIK